MICEFVVNAWIHESLGWDYHAFLEMANSELKTDSLHEYIQYTVCSKYVWMYSLDLQKCHILLQLYWIFKFLITYHRVRI